MRKRYRLTLGEATVEISVPEQEQPDLRRLVAAMLDGAEKVGATVFLVEEQVTRL